MQTAEDWYRARIQAMPREDVLRALFMSVDVDGDGELTRRELREAPFGAKLVSHWVELDKNHDEGVEFEEWLQFFSGLVRDPRSTFHRWVVRNGRCAWRACVHGRLTLTTPCAT